MSAVALAYRKLIVFIGYHGFGMEDSRNLADNKCVPCRGGIPPMGKAKAQEMLNQLESGWTLNEDGHLERLYKFKDFAQALAFVNRIGAVAEEEGHHPDIYLAWGKCRIEIWTHKINGLTDSDFFMAAKSDREFDRSHVSAG